MQKLNFKTARKLIVGMLVLARAEACCKTRTSSLNYSVISLILNMAPAFVIIKLQTLWGQKNTRLEEKGGEQQLTRHQNSEPYFSDILLDT